MTTIKSKNESPSIEEIAKNLKDAGIPPDFGDDNSRILIKMWRTLGQGEPATQKMTANAAAELGISFEAIDVHAIFGSNTFLAMISFWTSEAPS